MFKYHIWLEKATIGKRESFDLQWIHIGRIKIVFTKVLAIIILKMYAC